VKFNIGDVHEKLSRKPNLVKIGQKYWILYIETQLTLVVAGYIKLPQNALFD
jgi:hypothetical protein